MSLQLCWWEYEALLTHLRSREDLWTQSSDNELLWLREEPRQDVPTNAFGLYFLPPKDTSSLFRQYTLTWIPMAWDDDAISSYLTWLVNHWTSYRYRQVVTKFLTDELKVDPATAALSAIAIEGLSFDEDRSEEPPSPPLQEELWPTEEAVSLPVDFDSDPTLIGTYLLAGSAGWLQLRLFGGMIRASIMLRAKASAAMIPLQGLIRPLNGRVRDAAEELTGRVAGTTEPLTESLKLYNQQVQHGDGETVCYYLNEDCRGPVVPTTGLCEAHSGLLDKHPGGLSD